MDEALRARNELRAQRKREIERSMRMEAAGKKEDKRDQERDVSEKIALGQAQPMSKDSMFDQRLFNQSSGLNHGLEGDVENLYDKPLFADRTATNIYNNPKEIPEDPSDDEDEQPHKKSVK